ncbi:unnamed protein product [Cyprideis torosa]|uniref:chorismate synthase n=1 Tax=Cyprideis torosa TaxID=163714 RepID=A0A7R8WZ11_9CRUS|nr:unnamed protein product [Cyprideis torosa]CAG0910005.1 unnamed protein product [Cyprideis torosa]
MLIRNKDAKSKDYSHIKDQFRPSHADYTWHAKYDIRDYRGGGRSSARETAARVAAGAVAKLILRKLGVDIRAYVDQVGTIVCPLLDFEDLTLEKVESNPVRCPHLATAEKMETIIRSIRKEGDTIGGAIRTVVHGVPAGWGAPVFDKLQADLAKAMMSINATRGFEYGSGFSAIGMRGSEHNDAFVQKGSKIETQTNRSGGIQGGLSNGMPIYFRVAFKPVATLMRDQKSIDENGNTVTVKGKGRHDPCVVPRAVPIVEAMTALVLVDFYLRSLADTI